MIPPVSLAPTWHHTYFLSRCGLPHFICLLESCERIALVQELGLVCRDKIQSCKKPMLSELADKWYYQNTCKCCVLSQVETLTIAMSSFTGMFYLCVILNCSSVTLPCYSRTIIPRYTELCRLNWTICYIHKLWILCNVFNSEKKVNVYLYWKILVICNSHLKSVSVKL